MILLQAEQCFVAKPPRIRFQIIAKNGAGRNACLGERVIFSRLSINGLCWTLQASASSSVSWFAAMRLPAEAGRWRRADCACSNRRPRFRTIDPAETPQPA